MQKMFQVKYPVETMDVNFCYKLSTCLVLLILELLFKATHSATQAEINKHLELGKQFLAKGQLSDALSQYHAAVEGDPNNYLTYFKRGTVYLALGKAKNALSDLDRVIELKPDFTAARISRGSVHLKLANYDLAQLDFYNALKMDPYNQEANELIQRIQPAVENKANADHYFAHGDYRNAIRFISAVIDVSPWAANLFDERAKMHLANDDPLAAVGDIRIATKLQSDNTDGYFNLATILYQLGHASDALKSIRECLKLDPEHKHCFPLYKKIKKIEKFLTDAETSLEAQNYADCISSAQKVLKNENEEQMIIYEAKRLLCSCYSKDEQLPDAINFCGEALELNKDPYIYCDRGDAYINSEMYDDAIRDFKAALDMDQTLDRAKEGMEKAKKLQQQAERRDYYKILGVKKSASKKEIIKAYRKMAQKWHPDNYPNDEKMKKVAEKKFMDIAAAKEVLTDEEKRRKFDMGEDPLDPESGQPHMPNFHQFHSFQGSPFNFRFHFN
ncbi:dnaJ homolog subfamily C member 3 [Agrilus planipennis]|uniref:DnaJ homolog subfamily C member 3 n=1 Tax=Agrilus planipennis TaxID=224129 RepID=A0A1W4WIF7_AGRPL|nr:dnaJ homolog subfamily C member 3 [Agrilus planipennis]